MLIRSSVFAGPVVVASDATGGPLDGFSFLTSSWEAKQCGFLCFRKFKIPLVHLSFYFVKGRLEKRPGVCGNLELGVFGRESLVTSRTLYCTLLP